MPNGISRRRALLLAALPAMAEPQAPPSPPSDSAALLLESQRKRNQANSQAMAKFKLAPSVEPAFSFRA
jgi:hypothetical protein